jgi:hypothetical protein
MYKPIYLPSSYLPSSSYLFSYLPTYLPIYETYFPTENGYQGETKY